MNLKKIVLSLFFLPVFLFIPAGKTSAATLALSPSSGAYTVGSTITATILLNTQATPIAGVDILYLNYNPALLQVQDENTSVAGTQILPGVLMPITPINDADTVNGRIRFSQVTAGNNTTYTNSSGQTLATVRFRVLAAGTATVTFNFISGSTADSNVIDVNGNDVLTSVTNGSFTLSTATLTATISAVPASGTAPLNGVSLTGTAGGTAVGNINYTFYCNRADTGINITLPYDAKLDNTALNPYTAASACSYASGGTYTAKVIVERGSLAAQAQTNVIVSSSFDFSLSNGGARTVTQGSSVTNTVTATLFSGTTQSTSFSASGLPTGATATFLPTSCNPTCTSTLTITAAATTPLGTYTITVTGIAGALTRTTTFSLTVSAIPPPPTSTKFVIGDRVQVTASPTLNVRSTPGGTFLGTQPLNAQGAVIGGPTWAQDSTGTYYWWWNINYDTGVDGWSVEDFIQRVVFDFSLSNGGLSTVIQGSSVSNTITVTLLAGTSQAISFSASGLPTGATMVFSPTSCTPTCSSTLTITTLLTTPVGTYTITVTGTAGTLTRTTTFSLTVNVFVDTTPPSIPTGVTATTISTSQINIVWIASTDNIGVTGYRVYRNSTQIASPTVTNYSDTGLSPSTAYTYTVAAYDAAGNISNQSISVSATTQSLPPVTSLTMTPALEKRTSLASGISFTVSFLTPGTNTSITTMSLTTSATGQLVPTAAQLSLLPQGTYDIRVATPNYLSRKLLNQVLSATNTITLPLQYAGDFNADNIVNNFDWSIMALNWFTNIAQTDLNLDGITNTVDYSFLNRNWNMAGE